MKFRLAMMGVLAFGLSNVAAYADISGGPVFSGGNSMFSVRCILFNAGPGLATLGNRVITTGGSPVVLSADTCGASLAAGKACVISVSPIAQVAHSCRFVSAGGALRGTIAAYSTGDRVLHSSDLR